MGGVQCEVDFFSEIDCTEAVRVHGLVAVDCCVLWVLRCEVSYQVVGCAVSWRAVIDGYGVCTVFGVGSVWVAGSGGVA